MGRLDKTSEFEQAYRLAHDKVKPNGQYGHYAYYKKTVEELRLLPFFGNAHGLQQMPKTAGKHSPKTILV